MNHPVGSEEPDQLIVSPAASATLPPDEGLDKDAQKELAGYQEEEPLVAEEHLLRQEEETGEIRPVSQKPIPRMALVLVSVGGVIGFLGLLWAGFLAPRPARREVAVTPTPVPTVTTQDDSAALKANLAFQDQRRAVEPVATPTPVATSTPSSVRTTTVDRSPERPPTVRYVQSPPRVITRTVQSPPQVVTRTIQAPPRVVTRTVTRTVPGPPRQQSRPDRPPAPPSAPAVVQPKLDPGADVEPVDPMQRWAELAKLGQMQGTENKADQSAAIAAPNSSTSTFNPVVPPAVPVSPVSGSTPSSQSQQNVQSPAPGIPTITIGEPVGYNSVDLQSSIQTEKARFLTSGTSISDTPALQPTSAFSTLSSSGAGNAVGNATFNTVSTTGSDTQSVTESRLRSLQGTLVASADSLVYTADASASSKQLTEGEAGILNRTPVNQNGINATKEIPIGSSVSGRIIVPMTWNQAGQDPSRGRAAVELSGDLMAIDGTVGLPKGTILITQPEVVARNRMVSLSAVAIVYKDSAGRTRQQQIPGGVITINGKGNDPLISQGHFDPGPDVARQDLLVGVLSGLGKVGEIINRPRSVTVFNSSTTGSSQSTTTTTSDPNVLAAALEGFFGVTSERLAQRSDQATQELLSRPNIEVIPPGTEVTVFTNAFVKIRR